MNRTDEIYKYVVDNFDEALFVKALSEGRSAGFEASDIETALGVARNNVSSILNEQVDAGRLVKIAGRPVRFIPKSVAEKLFTNGKLLAEYTVEDAKKAMGFKHLDPFSSMVGYNSSLKYFIEQAKAAMMYPPNGLHTLILGPSGVGKTLFANVMYQYARMKKHKSEKEFPLVTFNCSDYYNNPQLLLSQLFGHAKGAFTGADKDKIGLVERADGGILFLDEIHRLTPNGQEMLFSLMDHGEYCRLGETEKPRKCKVLIIAATTENPHEVLLHTFLRRIPVMIVLPPLSDRGLDERLKIINKLFQNESAHINRSLRITSEVLKALVTYSCHGSIGQMESEIKQICAKSFLHQIDKEDQLFVEFSVLPRHIKDSIFELESLDQYSREYLKTLEDDLVILPSGTEDSYKVPKENIYSDLVSINEQMKREGISSDQINKAISKRVDQYIDSVLKKFNNEYTNQDGLYRMIDKNIVDFTLKMVDIASRALNREFNQKIVWVLAFHINFLVMRNVSGDREKPPDLTCVWDKHPREYEIAETIVKQISETFLITVAEYEKEFLAILLANENIEHSVKDTVGIIVLAHGNSTATSIAAFSNEILKANHVHAVDMPIKISVEETYKKVKDMAKLVNAGKGILFFVDMGSLRTFGRQISEETGISTRTIEWISTPLVIEALRRALYNGESLDAIYLAINQYIGMIQNKDEEHKPKAIIATCSTGIGTSRMLQKLIRNMLQEKDINDIEIVSLSYMTIVNGLEEYKDTIRKYEVIACVGNMNPNTDCVFFDMEEVLQRETNGAFDRFLGTFQKRVPPKTVFEEIESILEKTSLALNIKLAIKNLQKYFYSLGISEGAVSDSEIIKCILHTAYMLERLMTNPNQHIKFDQKEIYIQQNAAIFSRIKAGIGELESIYNIRVTEDEMCYLSEVVKAAAKINENH